MNPSICPHCRNPIPADAPGGLCPSCALLGAAQPTVVAPSLSATAREEVSAAFPDLEILELLGQGGMGMVFKARQPRLDRLVALKILPPHLAAQPGFAERFTREARALARLNHPHIVTVHDFGESGGFYYLLMEYVDGVNLRKAMQAGIQPEQAMLLVPRICEALQFAHDHGVLHRDIKPENILLDRKGRPKLADFGIAKLAGDQASGLTMSGAQLGTAAYMAPEQVEKPATVDHRADIYSLGVVFYEMLTGELPLGRFAAPSEKAAVGENVDAVVLRALEKERERRQQSAGEMKTQVEGVRAGEFSPPSRRRGAEEDEMNTAQKLMLALCMLSGAMIPASGMFRLGVPSSYFVGGAILFGVLFAIAGLFPGRRPGETPAAVSNRALSAGMARRRARKPWQSISPRRLYGMPLYHVVRGPDPATGRVPVARGFFALGPVARGVFALGGRPTGFVAVGGMPVGVIAIGGLALGVFTFGGMSLAVLGAAGGLSVGALASGGFAAGLAAFGGNILALEGYGGRLLYAGCQPPGALLENLLTILQFSGGATLLLVMALIQMSFFARVPSVQETPSRSGLRLYFILWALLALFPVGRVIFTTLVNRIAAPVPAETRPASAP